MKNTQETTFLMAAFIAFLLCMPGLSSGQWFSNPGANIGKKNLVVGAEYSQVMHSYELDVNELPTVNERFKLKVTAGLTNWLDLYVEGGGAGLMLDYKENDANTVKNFDSDYKAGLGLGARVRLLNFPNSQTRVFLQGGCFYFKTDDTIEKEDNNNRTIMNRDMKWADLYVGLGVVKRIDFMDVSFGVGFSEIKWWYRDAIEIHEGYGTYFPDKKPWRDSFEISNPVFGFLGLDFILPYEYRVSLQAGITNIDDIGFSAALSQGLERK